jgi:hypothetical protein
MELEQFVADFASGMERADQLRPQASSHRREGATYRPGVDRSRRMTPSG